jgi:hypothetical protein
MNNIIDLTATSASISSSGSGSHDVVGMSNSAMPSSHSMISSRFFQPEKSTFQPYISNIAKFESAISTLSKQRVLPQTVLAGIPPGLKTSVNGLGYPRPFKSHTNVVNRNLIVQPPNTVGRVLPSYQNKPHEQYQNRQYPTIIVKAKITFSLIDTYRFSIKAGIIGKITDEIIPMLQTLQGGKFNWKTCQWEFPLEVHDVLQVLIVYNTPAVKVPSINLSPSICRCDCQSCSDGCVVRLPSLNMATQLMLCLERSLQPHN